MRTPGSAVAVGVTNAAANIKVTAMHATPAATRRIWLLPDRRVVHNVLGRLASGWSGIPSASRVSKHGGRRFSEVGDEVRNLDVRQRRHHRHGVLGTRNRRARFRLPRHSGAHTYSGEPRIPISPGRRAAVDLLPDAR